MFIIGSSPMAIPSHYVAKALPPVTSVYLSEEEISTYGDTTYAKSSDVFFDGEGYTLRIPGISVFEVKFGLEHKVDYPYFLHIGFGRELDEEGRLTVYVNDQLLEHSAGQDAKGIDFDITSYLKEGERNIIRIENGVSSRAPISLSHIGVSVQFNPFSGRN